MSRPPPVPARGLVPIAWRSRPCPEQMVLEQIRGSVPIQAMCIYIYVLNACVSGASFSSPIRGFGNILAIGIDGHVCHFHFG